MHAEVSPRCCPHGIVTTVPTSDFLMQTCSCRCLKVNPMPVFSFDFTVLDAWDCTVCRLYRISKGPIFAKNIPALPCSAYASDEISGYPSWAHHMSANSTCYPVFNCGVTRVFSTAESSNSSLIVYRLCPALNHLTVMKSSMQTLQADKTGGHA